MSRQILQHRRIVYGAGWGLEVTIKVVIIVVVVSYSRDNCTR